MVTATKHVLYVRYGVRIIKALFSQAGTDTIISVEESALWDAPEPPLPWVNERLATSSDSSFYPADISWPNSDYDRSLSVEDQPMQRTVAMDSS